MSIPATRSNNRIFLILAVFCAVIAGLLIWFILTHTTSNNFQTTISVVVAKTDIPAGAPITASEVEVASEPQNLVPGGTFTQTSDVIGKILLTGATPETPITDNLFVTAANSTTATQSEAAADGCSATASVLTKGYVAIAIPATSNAGGVNNISADQFSAGYYIVAGDHIDILGEDGSGNVRYIMQDIPVLCVGTTAQKGASPSIYLVEVTRYDAEVLTDLFTSQKTSVFAVKYVVRATADDGSNTSPNYISSPASNSSIKGVNDPPVNPGTLAGLFANGG